MEEEAEKKKGERIEGKGERKERVQGRRENVERRSRRSWRGRGKGGE